MAPDRGELGPADAALVSLPDFWIFLTMGRLLVWMGKRGWRDGAGHGVQPLYGPRAVAV
jgi:hypothetical protein